MKLAIDQAVDLEFDQWSLKEAQEVINGIRCNRSSSGEDAERILKALLALLLFSQIEQVKPGTIERIRQVAEDYGKLGAPPVDE